MRKLATFFLAACALMLASDDAHAYKIHLMGKHHERMTWRSETCREDALNILEERCDLPESARAFNDIPGNEFRDAQYWEAARWPDDPTRQLSGIQTLPKFALNAAVRCPRLTESQGFMAGLLCSSHHGNLQFLHAMKSREGEDTRALIEGWSRFAFRVASGAIQPTDDYCEAVRQNSYAASERLAPENLKYCEVRQEDGREWAPWTVGTFFSFRCDKMFSSAVCDVLGNGEDDQLVQSAAKGALLHLIQDSFSQAHAKRGPARSDGQFDSRVDCSPVEQFYLYADNVDNHSQADNAPEFASNCRNDGAILDPITAGARLLHYIDGGEQNEMAAIQMIMDEVIGPASEEG